MTQFFLLFALAGLIPDASVDETELGRRIDQLDVKVRRIERGAKKTDSKTRELGRVQSRLLERSGEGFVLFLSGAVCALWAQNSGRNPWLWLFLGLIFSVFAVLFVLSKNAADIEETKAEGTTAA
jgi:L-fucose isomerase-like protein